uniref:Thrombospondin-like N-terminal domain-containing protein n=1 Tax=Mola mola TaxID=94237 RepID=A0A3Q3WME2_MOLML
MICFLRWAAFLWAVNSIPSILGMAVSEQTGTIVVCKEHRFSHTLDRFDLTEKFLLRKGTITEELPSFRLGSSPLIKPTKLLFPNGLPNEYSLVTVIRVRRTTKKGRWYLWQIFDEAGGSQISVVVDGGKKMVEFSFQGLLKNTLRYTFKSRDLHALFDRQWHKLSISVQSNIVSIYMNCKLIERRLTEDRDDIDPRGHTLITTRVENGRPVDVLDFGICSTFAFLQSSKYHKGRCLNGEISVLIQIVNGTPPPLVTVELPQMLSQPATVDRCHCPAEKVQSIPSKTGL